jgi:transcriptional regulator with XRE-family HTH domain
MNHCEFSGWRLAVRRPAERAGGDCVDMAEPDVGDGARARKREHLGAELRRARELSGLSGRQLAQRIGISQSKVSRVESGAALLSLPQVAAWASETGAAPDVVEMLSALTGAVYTEVHDWGSVFEQQGHIQGDIADLERRARRIRTFQPSLVPGLLQTAEYARRVFGMFHPPYLEQDLPEVLAARLDRQLALYRADQRFEFLITEAALRWRPGPVSVLLAQLDRIASLSTLGNVFISIIPLGAEAVTNTSHMFLLFDMTERDEGDAMVLVEAIHATLVINDPQSIDLYRTRWSLLSQMAVSGDEARDLVRAIGTDIGKSATLIGMGLSRPGAGDAAHAGALHPPGGSGGSVEVELTRLGRADELGPFGRGEPENRAVSDLGVADPDELQLAGFHAGRAAFAGPGESNHFLQRVPVHRTSLSVCRPGVSVPSIREVSRGDLVRPIARRLFGACSFPIHRTDSEHRARAACRPGAAARA